MDENSVKSVSATAAYEQLQTDPRALLVDVRSNMEFLFIGHPVDAISIPWIDEPDWIVNPGFAADIRKLILGGLDHDDAGHNVPIFLICTVVNVQWKRESCYYKKAFTMFIILQMVLKVSLMKAIIVVH